MADNSNKKVLGLIGARGGSKSIPRKNVKNFCGKPLIHWAIESGLASGALSRLILSTDDVEIASVGRAAGAEVPFMRPAEFAQDTSPSIAYITHSLTWLRDNERYVPDCVVLLEATSPGRRPFHIREAVDIFFATGADSVTGVGEVPGHFSPYWQFRVGDGDKLELFTGGTIKDIIRRRQDLPKTYCRNGSVYAFKPELLYAADPSLYGNDCRGYKMDSKYSFDIDTPDDWVIAEALFKNIMSENEING